MPGALALAVTLGMRAAFLLPLGEIPQVASECRTAVFRNVRLLFAQTIRGLRDRNRLRPDRTQTALLGAFLFLLAGDVSLDRLLAGDVELLLADLLL